MIIDLTLSSSDDDIDETKLMKKNIEQEDAIVIIDRVPLTIYHYNILNHQYHWVTDEIINAFSFVLSQNSANVHCCSTYFFTHLLDSRRDTKEKYDWIKRWEKRIDWVNRKFIFIPINWANSHWALAVLNMECLELSYYDSLKSITRSMRALNILEESLSSLSIVSKDSIKCSYPSRQIQQHDGSSCGVFVCWRMVKIAKNIKGEEASASPSEFRKTIREILFSNK